MSLESRVASGTSSGSSFDSGFDCFASQDRRGGAEDKRRVWRSFKEEVLDRLSEEPAIEERLKGLRITKGIRRSISATRDASCDEVSDFQAFLVSHGGHTGGWDDDEHAKFVNVFSRTDAPDEGKLMLRLSRALPARNSSEISQHITWYKEYTAKLNAKREALQRWRAERERSRLEKDLEAKPQSSQNTRESPDLKRLESEEKRRKATKEMLQRWKEEKMRAEIERLRGSEERTARIQIRPDPAVEEMRKNVREARKKRFDIVRQQQEEKERLEREVRRMRGRIANKAAAEFRERDLREVRGKIIVRTALEEEKAERSARIVSALKKQVPVNAERDPIRLKQPTMAALCRQYSVDPPAPAVPSGPVMSVRKISHRGVPAWRAELKGLKA